VTGNYHLRRQWRLGTTTSLIAPTQELAGPGVEPLRSSALIPFIIPLPWSERKHPALSDRFSSPYMGASHPGTHGDLVRTNNRVG